MGFNPFKKKDDFVDLSAHFRKQQELAKERAEEKVVEDGDLKKNFYPGLGTNKTPAREEEKEPAAPMFGIFGQTPEPKETGHSESNLSEHLRTIQRRKEKS